MNQLQNYHLFIRNNNIIAVTAILKMNCLTAFLFYALIKVEQRFKVERSVANEDQYSISAWLKKLFQPLFIFNTFNFWRWCIFINTKRKVIILPPFRIFQGT